MSVSGSVLLCGASGMIEPGSDERQAPAAWDDPHDKASRPDFGIGHLTLFRVGRVAGTSASRRIGIRSQVSSAKTALAILKQLRPAGMPR